MAISAMPISALQQRPSLPLPHHPPHARPRLHVPRGDVPYPLHILRMLPVILGHQRQDDASGKEVAGAVVRVRVAVVPLQRRDDDNNRIAVPGVLADALQKPRILLPLAVRRQRELAVERGAIDERKAQQLRLDAQRDDYEEADVREDSADAWQSTECNATHCQSISTTTNVIGS